MIKYYFETSNGVIFIILPLSVTRETIANISDDISASRVYYLVCDDVKLYLDF